MKKRLMFALLCSAALGLSGCGLFSQTPALDLEAAGATYGIGGTAVPSGTASVSIGATSLRAIVAPTVYTNSSGTQQQLTAPNVCGGQSVPSVFGQSNMAANAGVAASALPSASLTNGEGMAVGLPADLEAMADLQKVAGTNYDILKDCTGK